MYKNTVFRIRLGNHCGFGHVLSLKKHTNKKHRSCCIVGPQNAIESFN